MSRSDVAEFAFEIVVVFPLATVIAPPAFTVRAGVEAPDSSGKIVKSPFYLFQQINDELILNVESKTDSIKYKCDLKSKFKEDKSFWMIEFVKEIFKKNPYECKMFLNGNHSPLIIDSFNPEGSYNFVTFLVAPKE